MDNSFRRRRDSSLTAGCQGTRGNRSYHLFPSSLQWFEPETDRIWGRFRKPLYPEFRRLPTAAAALDKPQAGDKFRFSNLESRGRGFQARPEDFGSEPECALESVAALCGIVCIPKSTRYVPSLGTQGPLERRVFPVGSAQGSARIQLRPDAWPEVHQ